MSLENVVGFWQRLQDDPSLQVKVKNLARNKDEWAGKIVQLAGRSGYVVSEGEILETEAVIEFWQKVHSDTGLQTRLKPTREMQSEQQAVAEVVKIARDAGYVFSANALELITKAYADGFASRASHELSERQLDTVAAGVSHPLSFNSISTSLAINGPRIGNYVWAG